MSLDLYLQPRFGERLVFYYMMNADVLILAHPAENQKLRSQLLIKPKTRLMIPPDINAERVWGRAGLVPRVCHFVLPWHLATGAERPIFPYACNLQAPVPRVRVTWPELKASPSKSLWEALVAAGNGTPAYLHRCVFSNKFVPAGRCVWFLSAYPYLYINNQKNTKFFKR